MELSGLLGIGTNLLEKPPWPRTFSSRQNGWPSTSNDPDVRVVDMRGSVVTTQVAPGVEQADYRGARDEYLAAHIPGAVYVDWTTDIIDPDDPVPVQIAPPDRFAEAMAERGIGDDTLVVAVDHSGGQFATRLWWALTYYGHDQVRVLDGGWNDGSRRGGRSRRGR